MVKHIDLRLYNLFDLLSEAYQVPSLTVRGLTIQPCWIRIKDGDIVAYGQQPHCWMWEDRQV